MAMAPLPFDGDRAVLRWSFGTEQALNLIAKQYLFGQDASSFEKEYKAARGPRRRQL